MGSVTDKNRVEAQATTAGHVGGLLAVILMAGCAGVAKAPSPDPNQVNATQSTPIAAEVPVAPATATLPAPTSPATPPVTAVAPEPKATAPAATTPAKISVNPATAKPPAREPASAPAKSVATPPLDLKSLESRLKDTKAIGVMTKLALKNQVDDLLDQFREHYQGQRKTSLAELRRPYELLLQKVLALLQDSDPPLAVAIVASREAIWGILADPAKFAAI